MVVIFNGCDNLIFLFLFLCVVICIRYLVLGLSLVSCVLVRLVFIDILVIYLVLFRIFFICIVNLLILYILGWCGGCYVMVVFLVWMLLSFKFVGGGGGKFVV